MLNDKGVPPPFIIGAGKKGLKYEKLDKYLNVCSKELFMGQIWGLNPEQSWSYIVDCGLEKPA